MLVQTFTEVKIEMLKNHDFASWGNFVIVSCDRREDGGREQDQL